MEREPNRSNSSAALACWLLLVVVVGFLGSVYMATYHTLAYLHDNPHWSRELAEEVVDVAFSRAEEALAARRDRSEPPITRQDWDVKVLDGQTREVKADSKIWRFVDGTRTCYVFVQRNQNTWLPTMSCTGPF